MRFDEFGQWDLDPLNEDLRKWFREKWVRFGPDGRIRGECARGDESEGKPKCLPQARAHALGKKGRKYAASKKRREDPNPERSGSAINVSTKKKKSVTETSKWQSDTYSKRERDAQRAAGLRPSSPQWLLSELAATLGITGPQLSALANSFPGFPKVHSKGTSTQRGKGYYDLSEFKKWVITNNIKDVILSKKYGNQNIQEDEEQSLTEAREADLYHGTTILAAERILTRNMFKADAAVEPHVQHLLKKHSGTAKTVSFSRNFAIAQGFTASVGDNRVQGVIFVIDQDRLYRDLGRRIVPYNDLAVFSATTKKTENEEAVFGNIEDADRYIKEIIVLVNPGWYDRLDELDIGGRYPLVASDPRTRYLPRMVRRDADGGKPSYALGAKGQFYGRRELERSAEKTRSQSPEQLDELKCWTGYERVPGKRAGTPGSCRKRTNEEYEVTPLDDETVRRITVTLLRYWEKRDLKNINVKQLGDDSFRVTGSYPFGESIEVEYEFDRLNRKIRYVDKRIIPVKNEGLTLDSETYNPNLPPSSIDPKTGREADEYTVKPRPMSVPYMPTVPDTKEPPRMPVVPEPGKGIKKITESKCPECGGTAFSSPMLAEKRDACYHKVRSRYRVWPSAYASGALVQCRMKGAKNWGNKKK